MNIVIDKLSSTQHVKIENYYNIHYCGIFFQLYRSRTLTLKDNCDNEDDLSLWALADANVMTEYETDEEFPGEQKPKVFRRPKWRCADFNDLVDRMDQFSGKQKTYDPRPSKRNIDFKKIPKELLIEDFQGEDAGEPDINDSLAEY